MDGQFFPGQAIQMEGGPNRLWPMSEYTHYDAQSHAGKTSWTFNSVAIGSATSDRLVVPFIWWALSGSTDLSTVTIDGSAGTIVAQNDGSNIGLAGCYRKVAAGTSITISFTTAANVVRAGLFVYTVKNQTADAPHASHVPAGGAAGSRTATLNVPARGVALCCAVNSDTGTDGTFTNATEDFDQVAGSSERGFGATRRSVTALSSLGITNSGCRIIGAMSWG